MLLKNSPDLTTSLFEAYGLTPEKLLPAASGYRNIILPAILEDGNTVTAIIFKSEPGILETVRRADAVSEYLADQGFAVRQRLDRRIILLNKKTPRPRYAAIYSYLPGQTIPWEAYTQGHIKALGKTMSDMHAALATYSHADTGLPDVEKIYGQTLGRMTNYFGNSGVRKAMKAKLAVSINPKQLKTYAELLKQCRSLPSRQVLHMDFVRGNILFDDEQDQDGLAHISGILDFEKTAIGHPLFDIARTLAFLLVDCKFKTSDQVQKYFLYSGYAKRGKAKLPALRVNLNNNQVALLELLVDVFLLHDFYKFLRHNPYESLRKNEHYVRTRNILLERGLVQTTTPAA
ncbi:MAG TPA: phosphotransferase [Patescibacteria group bacterium]|nr:phosphotransferase [Patescibacteria group bacterium]